MKILAYCYNSCNPSKQIIKNVKKLHFWENKQCTHIINNENLNKFLQYNEPNLIFSNYKMIFNESKNELLKNSTYIENDYFVDFIKISY